MSAIYNQIFNREEYQTTRQTFLNTFQADFTSKRYKRGAVINLSLGSEVMLITEGRVKVVAYSEKGNERLLYILSSGDLMGEIDTYVEHSPDIEVICLTTVQMIVIPVDFFKATFVSNVELYNHLILSIIRKYQIVRSQLADTVFRDSKGKIAALLLRLCSQEGQYHDTQCEFFYIKHHEIAALIGCSRVTVTRVLHEFITEGILGIEKSKMIIYSESLLRQQLAKGTRD